MTDTERLAQAKAEILKDIEDNVLPTDVSTFAELHDHVDANWYGGLFDIDLNKFTETVEIANRLQDALDACLRADRPAATNPAQVALF